MVQPPDVGRSELHVDATTRVWKDDAQIKLSDIAANDEFVVEETGYTATTPCVCTDIWVGLQAQKHAIDQQKFEAQSFH